METVDEKGEECRIESRVVRRVTMLERGPSWLVAMGLARTVMVKTTGSEEKMQRHSARTRVRWRMTNGLTQKTIDDRKRCTMRMGEDSEWQWKRKQAREPRQHHLVTVVWKERVKVELGRSMAPQ